MVVLGCAIASGCTSVVGLVTVTGCLATAVTGILLYSFKSGSSVKLAGVSPLNCNYKILFVLLSKLIVSGVLKI